MAMTLELLVVRIEILEKQMAEFNIAKPDSKAKRTSGYLQHNTARRAEVKARLEAEGEGAEKIKATDVTKELAIIWKALSDDEREEWNAKAKAMKESPEWLNQAAKAVDLKLQFAPAPPAAEAELEAEKIDLEVEVVEKPNKGKKEKKEKKEQKEKKDDKPNKKRVSGYILFQKAMREDVVQTLKDALEEADAKVKPSDVMSELGKMWKALDDEEREEWNDKAAEQKASSDEE
jgi:hypothetical protein